MKHKRLFLIIITIALAIKLLLCVYAEIRVPQSKIESDTPRYFAAGKMLVTRGEFIWHNWAGFECESLRTPGYPLFLGILYYVMKIPFCGIIVMQILLTILAALITYKAATNIDCRLGFLSALIILFDPPITIFSLMLMTEALFLFLISLFMFGFVLYLKKGTVRLLVAVALILAAATYVRPISYYLGGAMAIFIVYANIRKNYKKTIIHALLFLIVVYSCLGFWQIRNYRYCGESAFSSIAGVNLRNRGLFNSYAGNGDKATQGWAPVPYYISVTTRCVMSLMTRPGSLKNLKTPVLTAVGKVLAYPWMVFWLAGFLIGVIKARHSIYFQFLMFTSLYFAAVSIVGVMWLAGERFRIPMMPFIAIISAYGWITIMSWMKKPKRGKQ